MTDHAESGSGCSDRLLVAILAGGEGSRIGGNKPLRMLGGTALIDRAVSAARRWSQDVVAVAREPEQIGPADTLFVRDAPGAEGPVAGLAAALAHARKTRAGLVLTIPCDTPFLPRDLFERLCAGLDPHHKAAVAASNGVLHPSCALWRTRAFDTLGPYLAAGRASLRGFAEDVGFAQVDWPDAAQDPFFNVNSPGDLAAAEASIRV